MDNFSFSLVGYSDQHLDSVFSLFDENYKVVGYKINSSKDCIPELVLYSYQSHNCTMFPYPYNMKQTKEFIKGWLKSITYPDFGQYFSDLSIKEGFFIFNEEYRIHVMDRNGFYDNSVLLIVQPKWAEFGK